jgi:hypothetical protein
MKESAARFLVIAFAIAAFLLLSVSFRSELSGAESDGSTTSGSAGTSGPSTKKKKKQPVRSGGGSSSMNAGGPMCGFGCGFGA